MQHNPRSQPVNAVYQVDGISDVNHDEQGDGYTDIYRQVVYAEQPSQWIEPFARPYQQQGGGNLHEELVTVADPDKVIRHARQVKHRNAHRKEQELVEHDIGRKVLDGITQIIAYAKHKAHGDKYHREKRQPAKPGNGYGMHFALVRYVEQAFLVGNQQDFGNDCHPKYQCQ